MEQNRLIEGVKGAKPVCNQLQPLVTQKKPILNILYKISTINL